MPRPRSPKIAFQNANLDPNKSVTPVPQTSEPDTPQPPKPRRVLGNRKPSIPTPVFVPKKVEPIVETVEEVIPETVEESIPEPPIIQEPVKKELKEEPKKNINNTSITVDTSNEGWGTIAPIKRRTAKNISQNVMNQIPKNEVSFSSENIEMLVNLIVEELSKTFVSKAELQRYVELSLQRIVMTDANKKI